MIDKTMARNDSKPILISIKDVTFGTSHWNMSYVDVNISHCDISQLILTTTGYSDNHNTLTVLHSKFGKVKIESMNLTLSNSTAESVYSMQNILDTKSAILHIDTCKFMQISTTGSAVKISDGTNATLNKCVVRDNYVGSGVVSAMDRSHLDIKDSRFEGNVGNETGAAIYLQNESEAVIHQSVFNSNMANYGAAIFMEKKSNVSIFASNFTSNYASQTGGAIFTTNKTSVLIDKCLFHNNTGHDESGALAINNETTITASNCTFTLNKGNLAATIYGRGYSTMDFTDCTFERNHATLYSGGVFGITGFTNLTLHHSSFLNNSAFHLAGVFYANKNSWIYANDCKFIGNNAATSAGVLYALENSHTNITNSTFAHNSVTTNAGVFLGTKGTYLTIWNSTFFNNSCTTGYGGVIDGFTTNTVYGSHFEENYSGFRGGAIAKGVNITIVDSQFIRNRAGINGGSMYCEDCGITCKNCTIRQNEAKADAGAIYIRRANGGLTIEGSDISNNTATFGNGGAIFMMDHVEATITNSTINHNKGSNSGGAMYMATGAEVKIENTVFANNSVKFMAGALLIGSSVKLSAINTKFLQNSAVAYGGAVRLQTYSEACFEGCSFIQNNGYEYAGAIYVTRSTIRLAKCNFENNVAKLGTGLHYYINDRKERRETETYQTLFIDGNVKLDTNGSNFLEKAIADNFIHSTRPDVKLVETPFASGTDKTIR